MKTPITDLEAIRNLAAQRYDEFEIMRYRLQLDDDLDDEKIDLAARTIAEPIVAAIDCKACANCCKILDVQLGEDDLEKLAAGLHTTADRLRQHVDIQDTGDPDIIGIFHPKPCPLLHGNLCSIYAHRPTACHDYPSLYPNFRWLMDYLVEGAATCPIIYNVLDAVSEQIDDIQRPS